MDPLPSLSLNVPNEQVVQFGNVLELPRDTRPGEAVTAAMDWLVRDVRRVCDDLGIAIATVLPSLQTYYVSAVAAPGPSGSDPLMTSYARRHYPTVYPTVKIGWKFSVNWVGDPPVHSDLLIEGMAR